MTLVGLVVAAAIVSCSDSKRASPPTAPAARETAPIPTPGGPLADKPPNAPKDKHDSLATPSETNPDELGSLVLYSNNGLPKEVISGKVQAVATVSGATARPRIGADSIARLRAAFEHMARNYKKGPLSVSMTLQVLDAMSAPTPAEYRRRIARLPVAKQVTRLTQGERVLEQRDYFVNGILKLRTVGPAATVASTPATDGPTSVENGPYISAEEAVAPSPVEDCEWTDMNNYLWSGECATEADMDEVAATLAAIDYEMEPLINDGNEALATLCTNTPEAQVCEPAENDFPTAAVGAAAEIGYSRGDDDPVSASRLASDFDSGEWSPSDPCIPAESTATAIGLPADCVDEAISFTLSIVLFALQRMDVIRMLRDAFERVPKVLPPLSAKVSVVFAITVSSLLLGLTIGAFVDCMW